MLAEQVDHAAAALGFAPQLRLSGPIDSELEGGQRDNLLAVTREALLNIASHAQATWVSIDITVDGDTLALGVNDDGIGTPETPSPGQGLHMMANRAQQLGGHFSIAPRMPSGTSLHWNIPLVNTTGPAEPHR
ncbi:MAG TPA: ATP-binding protein [Microlunatus sp.]